MIWNIVEKLELYWVIIIIIHSWWRAICQWKHIEIWINWIARTRRTVSDSMPDCMRMFWAECKYLQGFVNADKTQFIWLGTGHFLGNRDTQAINTILSSTDIVNNLGVYLDSELTLERQVSKLCQVCYFHLRRLRTVRRSLSKECLRTLVHAFVTSRVDHCNSLLYGSYSYLLDRLQSVLNSAARLVLNIAKFSGISAAIFWCDIASSALRQSTWLNCVVLSVLPPVGKASGLLPEATSSFLVSDSEHLVPELLLSRALCFGTHSHWTLDNLVTIYCNSKWNWKHFCSSSSERFCGSYLMKDLTSALYYYYYYYYYFVSRLLKTFEWQFTVTRSWRDATWHVRW